MSGWVDFYMGGNNMRYLSDDIRLGALMKPQVFGKWATDIGTCALGAAADAQGLLGKVTDITHDKMLSPSHVWDLMCALYTKWYPYGSIIIPYQHRVLDQKICGVHDFQMIFGKNNLTLINQITHLNDTLLWDRNRIADFVEGWEIQWGLREIPYEKAQAVVPVLLCQALSGTSINRESCGEMGRGHLSLKLLSEVGTVDSVSKETSVLEMES